MSSFHDAMVNNYGAIITELLNTIIIVLSQNTALIMQSCITQV